MKKNKLLTKKTKDETEFWTNWLSMEEQDRETYLSRLIPIIKRSLVEEKNLPKSLLGLGTAALLNNYFQDLEITIKNQNKIESDVISKSTSISTCRICGCTDDHACKGGCSWISPDLCSKCANKTKVKKK